MKFVMPIEGRTAEQLYDLNRKGSGGFYPIGLNNSYHGGMHFEGERLPIVAIADGTIVAYRLTSEYLEERSGGKTYKYSNCFVLIKHEYKTPKGQEFTFYSHYNHLAPWNDLTTWIPENGRYPHFVVKPGYKIKKDGVKVYKKTEEKKANILPRTLKNRENVVASPVIGKKDWVKIEGTDEYFICSKGNADKKDVVCIPELNKVVSRDIPVKAGTIIGYSGFCEAEGAPERYAAVHVEVFADEDAEDFINNVKGDGKPTLLKLTERQELKHINKFYTDPSAITKYTRNKGTEVQIIKEEGGWVQVKDVSFSGKVELAWLINKYKAHKHYTVNEEYIEQVKAQFPDVDIEGEEATDENKEAETSATHFKYKSGQGTTTRVITVAAGSPAQQYWTKKSFLRNNEINSENCDLWADNPDKVEVTNGGAVPYHCVVPSKEQITVDNVVLHRVKIGEVGGWVKEPEVVKVSPYDWLKCNFGVIKEQKDEGFSLFPSGSENDSHIDYKKLPVFFQQIFDRIDSNHDKIISDQELRNVIQDPRWARFLSHMICYHQTEWCEEAHGEEVERVKRHLGQDAAERLKARIRQLCWWDSVSERPGSKQLYHWSPVAFVEQMQWQSGGCVDTDKLKQIFTTASDEDLQEFALWFNAYCDVFEINTPLRVAHFLAQMREEVGESIKGKIESLNYAAEDLKRLENIVGADGKIIKAKGPFSYFRNHPNEADMYGRVDGDHPAQQEQIANRAYAGNGRGDNNGDFASGDGWKYRGRGFIQLTGKYNYTQVNKTIHEVVPDFPENIVTNPDAITTTKGGVLSAMGFWRWKNINAKADLGSNPEHVDGPTSIINLKTDTYGKRRENFVLVKRVLNIP